MKHLIRLSLTTLIITLFVTCDKENQTPTIQNVSSSPQTIKTGETTQLICVATDPDGDQLSYYWSSINGKFINGTSESSVEWQAPDVPGINSISVIVNDGENIVEEKIDITIEANPILSIIPSELDFGTVDSIKTFEIKNIGSGNLSWLITEDFEWLSVSKESNEITSETDQISLKINRVGLLPGKYSETLIVSGNGGSQYITIKFEVEEPNAYSGEFIDNRDGNSYKWVRIIDDIWMAENLAYLPEIHLPTDSSSVDSRYYVYDNTESSVLDAKNASNYQNYGVLYNWPAAQKACPSGWHLPTDYEWKRLEISIGMTHNDADDIFQRGSTEGLKLKATDGWKFNGNGTDSYHFSVLPAGNLNNLKYDLLGSYSYFWSLNEENNNNAWYRSFSFNDNIERYYRSKTQGFSVRCVKD